MNTQRILLAPWLGLPVLLRGIALIIWGLIVLGLVIAVCLSPLEHARSWLHSIHVLEFAQALIGICFMAPNAIVMRSIRHECVPWGQRDIGLGVGVYALASIAIPTLALTWVGAPSLYTLVLLTMGMGAGLLYSLGPKWMGLLVVVVWFGHVQDKLLAFIAPSVSWQLAVVAISAVVVGALVWWTWRRALIKTDLYRSGTIIMWLLGNDACKRSQSAAGSPIEHATQTWLSQRILGRTDNGIDVRGAGPHDRVGSIRVALGGMVLPRNGLGLLVKAIPLITVCVGMLLFVPLSRQFGGHLVSWWQGLEFIAGAILFVAVMMVVGQAGWLLVRWRKVDAELPLMALLPGMGDTAMQRANLLSAALGLPLMVMASLLIISLGMAISGDFATAIWVSLLLVECGFGAIAVAFVLNTIGGCSPSRLKFGCVCIATMLLMVFSFIALESWRGWNAFDVLLAALWLTLGVILCHTGWRGWKGLQQLAHPFIASTG